MSWQDTLNDATDALGITSKPKRVNARGDAYPGLSTGSLFGDVKLQTMDPVRAMTLVTNWLTAGGAPKPIDPVDIFGPAQAISGIEAKAAAGRGVAGLFGFGKLIGEYATPQIQSPATPGQAPLAPGVPYGAKPIPRFDSPGGGLFKP